MVRAKQIGILGVYTTALVNIIGWASRADAQGDVFVNDAPSLHAAIDNANANPGEGHNIYLAANVYLLERELIIRAGSVALIGDDHNPGTRRLVSNGSFRVMSVDGRSGPVAVNVSGVTIENGRARGLGTAGTGGGIFVNKAYFAIANSIIRDNKADGFGAGIYAQDAEYVYIQRSLIQNNVGSSAAGNAAACGGGGFTSGGGISLGSVKDAHINNSSIIGNRHCRWGGVSSANTTLVMTQNTIAQNYGIEHGGGVVAMGTGALTLVHNTIAENRANLKSTGPVPNVGAGLFLLNFKGRLEMHGSIIADNRNHQGNLEPDFATHENFSAVPAEPPFEFTAREYYTFIPYWTMSPGAFAALGFSDGIIGGEPTESELQPLGQNGAAAGHFEMPTYLVRPTSFLIRLYRPENPDWDNPFRPWLWDQRGFARPDLLADPEARVTLGSTEPSR